jgi:hypothetical protein
MMQLFLQENISPNPLAKEELNFLARLIGGMEIKKPSGPEPGFRLNLFTTDEEEEYVLSLFFKDIYKNPKCDKNQNTTVTNQ